MSPRSRYHRRPCPVCGFLITNNAMGRAAHIRACPGRAERIRRIEAKARTIDLNRKLKP